jgi:flavin-dependent dehydrogenase
MANQAKYDALIVGAGPAGSFAAERLARGGARVALFDGRPESDAKACGGGVTSKALKAWPFLLEAAARTVDEVEIHSPAGRRVRLKLQDPFAIYSRRVFDSHLRERARRMGAEVFEGRVNAAPREESEGGWVVRTRDGREWEGRVLVAADGANSPIARRLSGPVPNAEMEVAFGYRTRLDAGADPQTVIAFLDGWAGYAWAFPRLDHISFGIATTQESFDHRALDRVLWDFMVGYYRTRADEAAGIWPAGDEGRPRGERERRIEAELRETAERYAARIPGLAPETLDRRRAAGKDWALLGDAAGFADPVTGEGIYYGLRSAELFAEAFLGGRLESYDGLWRADFGRELRRASQMRGRFYGTFMGASFTDRLVDFARAHRGVRQTLCELIAGEQGYVNLKRTLVRRAFRPV